MATITNTDILSDVLRSLRATGTVYFCDQLQPPWDKQYPGDAVASFHHVRRGGCWLSCAGKEQYLGPGDMVFIAPGQQHSLYSTDTDPTNPSPDTLLLCGYCEFDEALAIPLSELFPNISILRDEQLQEYAWLRALLDNLSSEYQSNRPGTRIVVNKLTEVLIVELIRMNFGQQNRTPLLRALADKHIAHALNLLHEDPAKPWSLDSLATTVGMSRAGFAKRFKSLVEYSMFDYLTQLRLQRARELLIETELPIYAIANQVGYESDLAFARTFKKRLGITPTAFRNDRRPT